MGVEIERKFLVNSDDWRASVARSEPMSQAYLASHDGCSIRIRLAGEAAQLNIKGRTVGARRLEFEYPVPREDAEAMLNGLGGPRVEKTRHYIPAGDLTWEVDEFSGDNAGLVVAEIELPAEDASFPRPDWLGKEVTGDERYYNMALAQCPYRQWDHESG